MNNDTTRPAGGQKMKLGKAKVPARAAPLPKASSEASPEASAAPDTVLSIKTAPAPKDSAPKNRHSRAADPNPAVGLSLKRPRQDTQKNTQRPAQRGRPLGHAHPQPHQPRPRVFFALKVPAEVAAPLGEAQKALRGNWRAVRSDQMHVTFVYLPSIDPTRIDDLKRLGVRLAQELAPLEVRLRGTGYFPNEGSPRVWFVKVEGEGLDELAAALRSEVAALGLETEDTNFRAHITLARKKGPAPRVAPHTFELGWQAPQLVLYRSHLQKTGPVYEVLSTFKFRG